MLSIIMLKKDFLDKIIDNLIRVIFRVTLMKFKIAERGLILSVLESQRICIKIQGI